MMAMMRLGVFVVVVLMAQLFHVGTAFQVSAPATNGLVAQQRQKQRRCRSAPVLASSSTAVIGEGTIAAEVDKVLSEKYPTFRKLMGNSEEIWNVINSKVGFTLLVPNEEAFQRVTDETEMAVLKDDDMSEMIVKYHLIEEPISLVLLFVAGCALTMAGQFKTRGAGYVVDGGSIYINKKAKIVETIDVGKESFIHVLNHPIYIPKKKALNP